MDKSRLYDEGLDIIKKIRSLNHRIISAFETKYIFQKRRKPHQKVDEKIYRYSDSFNELVQRVRTFLDNIPVRDESINNNLNDYIELLKKESPAMEDIATLNTTSSTLLVFLRMKVLEIWEENKAVIKKLKALNPP